jgi:hypothetical protein
MNVPDKYRHAEETYLQIKTLTESRGWQEFLLPYIRKEMADRSAAALLDPDAKTKKMHQLKGGYAALHELLQYIERHQKFAAGVIAKDELKVNSPGRS